ncbi:MAG TPA: RsmF rRNA methyltransferase first C-terminal domain-containing protein [Anaerolineales bacterium]|nr:RsmF rRNA methyltransferase first C-terminal domain-containing protein [Anaerolineales bacterium]
MNSNLLFPIPQNFYQKFRRLMPEEEADVFFEAIELSPSSGVRINRLKLTVEEFSERAPFKLGEEIPWCADAFFLPEGQKAGTHPYHQAGLYYLQDPSAMTPAEMLDPQPEDWVLDLSASPGGKTTQIAAKLRNSGLLVANEIKNKRLGHLIQNVERWGAENVVVTNETPERLADTFGPIFDKVLVDAPCSGEGMFRKDASARRDWSQELVEGCAIRQKNILDVAVKLVKPGGKLVYSTCTFSPEEDEGVIAEILARHPDYKVEDLPAEHGFDHGKPEWIGGEAELSGALRLFPHHVTGEGHFVCRLVRSVDSVKQRFPKTIHTNVFHQQLELWEKFIDNVTNQKFKLERLLIEKERLYYLAEDTPEFGKLRVPMPGLWLGTLKKDRFEPAHPLAMALNPTAILKKVDLPSDGAQIRKYLRGEPLDTNQSGWLVVMVDGFPIGWGKGVNGILKNHFPRGLISPW